MKFHTGRQLAKVLIVLAIAAILSGYAFFLEGDPMRDMMISVGGVLGLLTVGVIMFFCRCPYCGKILVRNLFNLKECPFCKRNLSTGVKVKGKKNR